MKELRDIMPKGEKVMFGEEVIEVKTFAFEDVPYVAEIVEKIFNKFDDFQPKKGKKPNSANQADNKKIVTMLTKAAKEDLQSLAEVIRASSGLEVEFIKKLSIEAIVFLLEIIVKVNANFFSEKVAPALGGLMDSMNLKVQVKNPKTGE